MNTKSSAAPPEKLVLFPALSAYKIPLLALIEGYCHRSFPLKTVPPILSSLVNLIIGDNGYKALDGHEPELRQQHVLEQQINNTSTDSLFPSLTKLIEILSKSIREYHESKGTPADKVEHDLKSVINYLLSSLWTLSSLDKFHGYLTNSPKALLKHSKSKKSSNKPSTKIYLSPTSFLGKFVNQMVVSFEVLTFDETVMLWKSFSSYREETRKLWEEIADVEKSKTRNKHGSKLSEIFAAQEKRDQEDNELQTLILKASGKEFELNNLDSINIISQVDLTQLLEYHVQMLQRYAAPAPNSLRRVLKLMSESQRGVIPSAYYIEYLQNWKENNYEGSFNALHRYFDYMMSNKQQLFYHYALLSLATLHASFGSDEEALRAIDEAILVARENKDLDCLNYLLTWLFNFLKDKPELYAGATKASNNITARDQILQFLKIRTKENKNWLLQSISYQFQASQDMLEGSSLHKVLENIVRAAYILINFETGVESQAEFVRNCQLSVTTWSRVGVTAFSDLYIDIAKEISNDSSSSLFDRVSVTIRDAKLKYMKGEIDEALDLLKSCEQLVSDDMSLFKVWQSRLLLMKLDSWLLKCRIEPCSILLNQLNRQLDIIADKDLYYEVKLLECNYNTRVGNNSKALLLVSEILNKLKDNEPVYSHIWFIEFQIIYADILVQTSTSPEKALTVILNAIKLAQRASLTRYVMKGALTLIEMLLLIDSNSKEAAKDCEAILNKIIPTILQMDDLLMKSKAYYLLAKVIAFNIDDLSNHSMKVRFNKVLEYLEVAIVGFKKLNDLQMLMKSFDIELSVAQLSNHRDLVTHAEQAQFQLKTRIHEESLYGLC